MAARWMYTRRHSCLRGGGSFHAGRGSFRRASSERTPRTDSLVTLGYASTIWLMVMPAASDSRVRATEMRVPRTRGLPPRCSASEIIQLSISQAYASRIHDSSHTGGCLKTFVLTIYLYLSPP